MLLLALLASTALAAPSATPPGWDCVDYAVAPAQLVELEGQATIGALSEEQQSCLETAFKAAQEQTTKNKISRVLLVNAYAYETAKWAKLVQRHLDEVDQSDPNVAYLYSFYLYNRPENPDFEASIHWAGVALERKQDWSGDVHVKRVEQLMKVRALAAAKQWEKAAAKGDMVKFEEYRLRTKTFAREWLDFAKSAGRETKNAAALCVSAASTEACGIQPEPAPEPG